jgi:hypothetical protein
VKNFSPDWQEATNVSDLIAEYMKTRLRLVSELLVSDTPPLSDVGKIIRKGGRQTKELTEKYGDTGVEIIVERARRLVGTVFGGEPAPPPVQWPACGRAALDADVVAEQLARNAAALGFQRSSVPDWRTTANRRLEETVERANKMLETRAEPATPAKSAEPRSFSREEVERIVDDRLATAAHRTFADMWQGGYQRGTKYERGQAVTEGGSVWLALASTEGVPGASSDWKLIVKRGRDGRDAKR